ncbi:zinc finger protein 260 isoform X1 [Amyelois transitella]|uniref:zinc finger protein 260 isoform X1 n=1 Tax=Amyelois transitella TaxID=680683 RepID=UPI0029906C15|nr:zinc finger protein 260 isoform X1 [Amyelois transitella]
MDSRINNGICRCCASEGTFKDLATTYHWMGEEEIYAEMLKECFDIQLSAAEDSEQGGICEVCITQLRNASNFKKQVLHTEKQFKKRLQDKLFKSSIVKVEVPGPDDDALESDNDNNDDFSGTEYDVPIKEEEPADEPKPRKRAARATTSRAKKSKTERGETSTKRYGSEATNKQANEPDVSNSKINLMKIDNLTKNIDQDISTTFTKTEINNEPRKKSGSRKTRSKIGSPKSLMAKHLHNIREILLYSNATPIKSYLSSGYLCSFCAECFTDPADLKGHTLDKHDESEKTTFMQGSPMINYVAKLDVTDLKCYICHTAMENLKELLNHLRDDHDKKFFTDIEDHILPFKFSKSKDNNIISTCVICSNVYLSFKQIQEHMNAHYSNYVCDDCSKPFVNMHAYKCHMKRHEQGAYKCSYCEKVFSSNGKRCTHENHVHIGNRLKNKCPHCPAKFVDYYTRKKHMVEEHGAEPVTLNCLSCEKVFSSKVQLRVHTKRDHLLERNYECTECNAKFFSSKGLKQHKLKHTSEKQFKCEFCAKEFARSFTLREHLRIHLNDRRYECAKCGHTFIYKCSWQNHMRSKHGETL